MGAPDILGRLALAGVRLWVDGDNLMVEPRSALTEELRGLIRAYKPALMESLAPVHRGMEVRRQRVLAKLAQEPDKSRVAVFDTAAEKDFVILTLAIRNVGTCELRIPRDRYDPWLILEAMSKAES